MLVCIHIWQTWLSHKCLQQGYDTRWQSRGKGSSVWQPCLCHPKERTWSTWKRSNKRTHDTHYLLTRTCTHFPLCLTHLYIRITVTLTERKWISPLRGYLTYATRQRLRTLCVETFAFYMCINTTFWSRDNLFTNGARLFECLFVSKKYLDHFSFRWSKRSD